LRCADAVRLIAAAVEGGVALRPLQVLVGHIEGCTGCAAEAETQMLVKRALGATPMLALPAGAAERLRARLDREALTPAKSLVDWRALTMKTVRLVPLAACLVAVAAVIHHVTRRSSASEVSTAIAEWGRDEMRSLQSPRIEITDRQLLGVLLIDPKHADSTSRNRETAAQ